MAKLKMYVDGAWVEVANGVAGGGGGEPALGNPAVTGYVLSSTTAGVRSWVAQSGGGGGKYVCDGRLTLTTATPITTSDVTAATTLYFTPYNGDQIGLYDGSSAWTTITFAELSLDISGYTADKNYDIWVYNNSGTATMDSTVWTDNATRATALTTINGIYVKTGATTRRYVGTIRITTTTGQCEDSETKRYVWNMHNRSPRIIYKYLSDAHTYNSSTKRPWNNSGTNKIDVVNGISDTVNIGFIAPAKSGNDGQSVQLEISIDDSDPWGGTAEMTIANYNNQYLTLTTTGTKLFSAGYHYATMVESTGVTTANFTWYVIRGYING